MKIVDIIPSPGQLPTQDPRERASRLREILMEQGLSPDAVYSQVEMNTRFVDAHQDTSYAGEVVPPHSHGFHEMICCIGGSADYLTGEQRIHITHGDILSIPAGLTHGVVIPENPAEPYRRYVLWLSQEYVQLIQTMFLGDAIPTDTELLLFHTGGADREHIGECFHRCVREREQQQLRWETAAFGIASELAAHLARLWQGQQGGDREKPELLDGIMRYVEGHLAEKITVSDIAARFWVSQSTISQLFRRKLGVSFYHYVTLRRLRESRVLIHSSIPMEQVSISVGFQDYSSFYRAFKSEFGISPAQYRKQQ